MENINHYKLFFNNITSASVICEVFVDIDGNPIDLKIIDMNVCFETLLKSSKADLLGKTLTELNLVQNKQRMKEILDGALKGNSYTDEIYVESTNKYIKITAFQLEKGQCAILADDVTNNKKTEEALKESEERYRNFFQSANEGIFQTTRGGRYLNVNPAFVKMFGFNSKEEMINGVTDIGKQLYVNPGDREIFKKILSEKGYVNGFEIEVYRKDKSKFWISTNAHVIRDDNGNILYLEGTNEDITARKLFDSAMKESELKFRSIFQNSPNAISLTKKGEIIIVNDYFLKMFGYDKVEELLGENILSIYHPDSREIVDGYIQKRANDEYAPLKYDTKGIKKNGKSFDMEVNISTYNINDEVFTMAVMIDITERKSYEDNLQRISNFYNNVLESTPVSVIVLDINFNVVMFNKYAEKMFRMKKNQVNGRNFFDIRPEFGKYKESLLNVVVSKEIISREKTIYKVNDKNFFFNVIIYPIVDKEITTAIVLNIQDVTENVILEENLIQSEKLKSLGELSAGMAHEINQPLTGIIMSSDNIMDYISEDEIDKVYIENKLVNIVSYADRIKKIIEHVRAFSREQSDTLSMAININDAIENSLSLITMQYKNRDIDLKTTLIDNPPKIKGNIYKIEQVILALLSNSKDAILEKSKNKSYKDNETKTIEIKTYLADNLLYLEVFDNGIGIDEENQKKIFIPFFTTKEVNKGTGLGLSIVYGIVKEMGGNINIISAINEFTKITVSFKI